MQQDTEDLFQTVWSKTSLRRLSVNFAPSYMLLMVMSELDRTDMQIEKVH